MPTDVIWVQLKRILCRTRLSRHLNFLHPGTLTLSPERQSPHMSKTTNDGLILSGT